MEMQLPQRRPRPQRPHLRPGLMQHQPHPFQRRLGPELGKIQRMRAQQVGMLHHRETFQPGEPGQGREIAHIAPRDIDILQRGKETERGQVAQRPVACARRLEMSHLGRLRRERLQLLAAEVRAIARGKLALLHPAHLFLKPDVALAERPIRLHRHPLEQELDRKEFIARPARVRHPLEEILCATACSRPESVAGSLPVRQTGKTWGCSALPPISAFRFPLSAFPPPSSAASPASRRRSFGVICKKVTEEASHRASGRAGWHGLVNALSFYLFQFFFNLTDVELKHSVDDV